MDSALPRTSIVVPLRCRTEQALACLQAIATQPDEPAFEVILVAHGAPWLDRLLAGLQGDVRVVSETERLSLAAAIGRGLEQASADTVVVLAEPVLAGSRLLAPLLDALDDADGAVALSASTDPERPDAPITAAAAVALRRGDAELLTRAGVPDELVVATAVLDLAQRGRRAVVAADSRVTRSPVSPLRGPHVPGTPTELTIVIPTLDATSPRMRDCLTAIAETTEAPHQVLVVDNGAPPQGFTAPVNVGLRGADSPYLVVMNDDVLPLPGWWPPLRRALDEGAEVAFPLTVGGAMREDFAAWCFALDRETVTTFGHSDDAFLDPSMVIWFQDTDLLTRLRRAGRPPVLVAEARIRHGLSQTVTATDPALSGWVREQIGRDHVAFTARHPDVTLTPLVVG